MNAVVLALILPWFGFDRLPSQNRYEYRQGCSRGCVHCRSCRSGPYGTCHDYRRLLDYPWGPPRTYRVPPCYDTLTRPDIIHITPLPPPIDESSPSDRKF